MFQQDAAWVSMIYDVWQSAQKLSHLYRGRLAVLLPRAQRHWGAGAVFLYKSSCIHLTINLSVNKFLHFFICVALVLTLTRITSKHKLSIKQKPWILLLALSFNHTLVFMAATDVRLPLGASVLKETQLPSPRWLGPANHLPSFTEFHTNHRVSLNMH